MNNKKKVLLSFIMWALANGGAATARDEMYELDRQIQDTRSAIDGFRDGRDAAVLRILRRNPEYVNYENYVHQIMRLRQYNDSLIGVACAKVREKKPNAVVPCNSSVFWMHDNTRRELSSLRQIYDVNHRRICDFERRHKNIEDLIKRVNSKCDSVMYAKIDSCQHRLDSLLTRKWDLVQRAANTR